ncbi:MAG TPA: lysophospholipid acyltransferase family protein [Candidatus Dormibacteraeota bacterium]|nr:lysophospholipid acyltransferase family protein [Candidatus Dormibacteraeota bacterium]
MTETVTPRRAVPAGDDAGPRSGIELNGAVVLRPHHERRSGADVTARVQALHAAVVAEIERRRDAAQLEPADSVAVPIKQLSSLRREAPRIARGLPDAMRRAPGALADIDARGAVRSLLAFAARQRELAAREGSDTVDEFGFDREWTEELLPFFAFLYRKWWRVEVRGLENVPSEGAALLVSNHAGVLPYDGAMIRTAIHLDHPSHRHARALILNAFFGVPLFSWFLRRTGNTLAHPDDAARLLESGELVLVFPEGVKGTGKPYGRRYRLSRFGRGGFASIALRAQVPIIPVSVVGSEEIHPLLADLKPVARLLGMPYAPITPTFPWLGPLGLVPLPSSWIIEFHAPVATSHLGPEAADDAALVMELTDAVRDTVQEGLWANLERRGSIFA